MHGTIRPTGSPELPDGWLVNRVVMVLRATRDRLIVSGPAAYRGPPSICLGFSGLFAAEDRHFSRCHSAGLRATVKVRGQVGCPGARRRMMQPYVSQALLGIRVAEMRREAEAAGLARDVEPTRRLRRALARIWSI